MWEDYFYRLCAKILYPPYNFKFKEQEIINKFEKVQKAIFVQI